MGFIDERKEYVIENMYPQRPFMNYLWNEEYIAVVNQFCCGKGRISSENGYQRNVVKDSDCRLLYIKYDDEVFAANRNYNNSDFKEFKTIVGQGYSTVVSEYKGIKTEFTLIVPHKGKRELWKVKLTNTSNQEKAFDLYAYCETDSRITGHWGCDMGDFNSDLNGVEFSHKIANSPTDYHVITFSTNAEVTSFDTTKRRFVGTYGSLNFPVGTKAEKLASQGTCFDGESASVLQSKLTLKPNEGTVIFYTVGAEKTIEDAIFNSKEILNENVFEKELEILKAQSQKYDSNIWINTPDEEVNRFANIWLKRQMELGKTWGRVYNKGFRDIMQDISGFIQLDSAVSRLKLLDCMQYQKEDGNTLRSWVPLDLHPYRDGAVWLIMSVVAYMKETLDWKFLEEKVGYYESDIKETVFEHCIRGLEFLYTGVGKNGLCLWGGGDWNDSFDTAGLNLKGESVWLSIATVKATNDFLTLLEQMKKYDLLEKYTQKRDEMTKTINIVGMDTDHYIYGITDWGEKVGSYETKEGQIFLNPQTWSVLAHICDDENKLMDMVEKELSCDFGYVQQKPCYTVPDPHVGRITYFGKGLYENGSVYNHGVAFKIVADCEARRPDYAYETLKKLLPSNPKNSFEHSGVEPYALCNMYLGPENDVRCGEAPMNWITGTTSWTFRGIVEYILGVRADYDGLVVKPQLPKCWNEASVTRTFRNATYKIEIKRTGEEKTFVDNNETKFGLVKPFDDNKVHTVLVCIK